MSMTDFQDVRDEITRTILLPDLAAVHRRGRRLRGIAVGGWALGSVAVVAVVALLVTQVIANRAEYAVPADPPAPVHGPLHGAAFTLNQPVTLVATSPFSDKETYAVVRAADHGAVLARTYDAGAHWQAWRFPAELGSEPLLELRTDELLVAYGLNNREFVSRDGGQSWGPEPALGKPVERLPVGWQLAVEISKYKLVAVGPSGIPHPFVHQPVMAMLGSTDASVFRQATDGSLWVNRNLPNPDSAFPAVSRDSGRSWSFFASQGLSSRSGSSTAWDTYDGTFGVAMAAQGPRVGGGVTVVYSTHDGGRSWQLLSNAAPGMLEFPIVKPDGSILAVRTQPPGGLVLSADAGRNFTTVPGKEGVNFLERSPSGTLVAGQVSGPPLLSADGISWTPAPTVPGTR